MAKSRKGGIHASNQAKANARWKQVSKDLGKTNKLTSAQVIKSLAEDTTAALSDIMDAKSAKEIAKRINEFRQDVTKKTEALDKEERQANYNLSKALKTAGDDQAHRELLQQEFQEHVFDKLDDLREKQDKASKKFEASQKKAADELVSKLGDKLEKIRSEAEKQFQSTRNIRSREARKEIADRAREERMDNDPIFKLQEELKDLQKQRNQLSGGYLKRYAYNPARDALIGGIKNKYQNFKDRSGISAVSRFLEKERTRKDSLDALNFKIASNRAALQGTQGINAVQKSAYGDSGSLDAQADERMESREVAALESIAQSLRLPAKGETDQSSLLNKMVFGLPLIASGLSAAVDRLGGTVVKALTKAYPAAKSLVTETVENAGNLAKKAGSAIANGAKSSASAAYDAITNPVQTLKKAGTAIKSAVGEALDTLLSKANKAWANIISAIRSAPSAAVNLSKRAGRALSKLFSSSPSKNSFFAFIKELLSSGSASKVLPGLRKLITGGLAGIALGVLVDTLVDTAAQTLGLDESAASLLKIVINGAIALVTTGGVGLAIYLIIEASIYAYENFEKFPDKESVLKKLKGIAEPVSNALSKSTTLAAGMITQGTLSPTVNGVPDTSFSSMVGDVSNSVQSNIGDISSTVSKATASAGAAVTDTAQSAVGAAKSVYKNLKSAVGKLFRLTSGNIDLDNVNPVMQERFLNMIQEYEAATGEKVDINSAYRSYAKQAALHKADPKRAAAPGSSLHELGLAIDAKPSQVDKMKKMGLLDKYGLEGISGSNERQHIQIKGGKTYAKANGLTPGDYVASRTTLGNNETSDEVDSVTPIKSTLTTTSQPTSQQALNTSVFTNPISLSGSGALAQGAGPMSIDSIPTFSYQDHSFFALNLGAIGG